MTPAGVRFLLHCDGFYGLWICSSSKALPHSPGRLEGQKAFIEGRCKLFLFSQASSMDGSLLVNGLL